MTATAASTFLMRVLMSLLLSLDPNFCLARCELGVSRFPALTAKPRSPYLIRFISNFSPASAALAGAPQYGVGV